MASAFDSPDTVQLKGKPTGVTRLSRKAKIGMTIVGFAVGGFILFSIMSMGSDDEAAPAHGGAPVAQEASGEKPPTVQAAKPNFDNVGDGQAAVAAEIAAAAESGTPTPALDAATARPAQIAPTGQSGQNVGPSYSVGSASTKGEVPKLAPAALVAGTNVSLGKPATPGEVRLARAGAAGPGDVQQYQSAEEREAIRIKKDVADRKEIAVRSSLDAQGSSDMSASTPGGLGLGANPTAAIAAQAKALLSTMGQSPQVQSMPAFGMGGGQAQQQDDPNKQGRKEQFLKSNEASAKTYLKDGVQPALSPYEIKAGWAIPAALQCGINSDLPGQTCARVTENVFDSATGRHLLIPQNSRLVGTYDSQIAYGQERILVVWNRLIFPDGSSISLEGMPGSDKAGNAGFDADVNNHYAKVFGSAAFMATFSAAVSLTQKQNTSVNGSLTNSQTITQSLGQQLGQTGSAFIQRGMNVQPTLTRKPGYRFNVMVTRDILLPSAYRGRYAKAPVGDE